MRSLCSTGELIQKNGNCCINDDLHEITGGKGNKKSSKWKEIKFVMAIYIVLRTSSLLLTFFKKYANQ